MSITYCLKSVDMLCPCLNIECVKYAKHVEPEAHVTYRWINPKTNGNECPEFQKKK